MILGVIMNGRTMSLEIMKALHDSLIDNAKL